MPTRRLLPALLAASLAAGCAEETTGPSTSNEPRLQLSATALAFQGTAGGSAPAAQVVTVTNAGGGQLAAPVATVSHASGSGWLAATVSGTAAPYAVTVQAAVAALAEGTYRGTVQLASAGASNSPRTVDVTLTVLPPPRPAMQLSATALQFLAADASAAPAAQAVTVTASGPGPLAAPAATVGYTTGSGWLSAEVTGTSPPYTVTVRASPAGLAIGAYAATVELATASASNSPQFIAVTLLVGRPVLVSRLISWWGDDGTATELPDPAVQSITLTQDAGGGGTTTTTALPGPAPGTWGAAGGSGPYLLTVDWSDGSRSLLWSGADAVDLGADVGGRPDRVATAQATTATLDLSGLYEWTFGYDAVQIHSWSAQASTLFDSTQLGMMDLYTDVVGHAFDWDAAMGIRLVAADVLRYVQGHEVGNQDLWDRFPGNLSASFVAYRSPVAWVEQAGLTVTDGAPLALAPPAMSRFQAAPAWQDWTGQLALDWRKADWEGAVPAFPRADAPGQAHRVGVYAMPAPLAATAPLGALALPLLETTAGGELQPPVGTWEPNCGTLLYGRFLPARFAEVVHSAFTVGVTRKASDAAGAVPGLANVVSRWDAVAAPPVPVAPLVGGVRSPTIDGQDALVARAVATATPTLAWQAPLVGTPTSYRVLVYRLTAEGAASRATFVAEAVLDGATTTFAVPAGLLSSGQAYAAQIAARVSPTDAGGASPWRAGVPFGEAVIWTERFTVP